MKTTSSIQTPIIAVLLPALSAANVGISWSADNVPDDSGLGVITFLMTMEEGLRRGVSTSRSHSASKALMTSVSSSLRSRVTRP